MAGNDGNNRVHVTGPHGSATIEQDGDDASAPSRLVIRRGDGYVFIDKQSGGNRAIVIQESTEADAIPDGKAD